MIDALVRRLGRLLLHRSVAAIAALYYRYGNTLLRRGQFAAAISSYDRALQLNATFTNALYNRGIAFQNLKKHHEAVSAYDRLLELKPNDAEAFNNRGNALRDLGRYGEALTSYERALACQPRYLDALHNQGLAFLDLKRPEDAARSLCRLHALAPDYDFVKGQLLHSKMLCCDWKELTSLAESLINDLHTRKLSAEPFGYQGVANSAQDLKICAEIYADRYFPRHKTQLSIGQYYRNARIRIGYLSGEFRNQATAVLMAELFELHDKSRFEIFAFDNGWDDGSEIRRRLVNAFDEIVDISRLADYDAALNIRHRKIDILVNLNGYFGHERQGVFSYKPSPIQVNYLGFPGTLGADYIDYIIADRHVIPPNHQENYTEEIVYLPDTYQVNDSKRRITEPPPTRGEANLPESAFVFCCFNNNYKITPVVFDVWMRLLNRIPDSVLWLLEDNEAASRNLRREARLRGVTPERIIFSERVDLGRHLSRHQLADLFLDTLPYNAHTTASDALWAALPLLTCTGTTFPGRVAGSLLNAVGLPDLITESMSEYEALAVKLATTPGMLEDIRARLARNRKTSALFNTDRFRRHIESAYQTMLQRHQNGKLPEGFSVTPISHGANVPGN